MSDKQSSAILAADALRPPIVWQAVQACFDDPIYTPAGTAELLLAIGRPAHRDGLPPERVREALREITANFAFERYNELQPTVSKQDAQVAKLAQACRLLLETAGMDGEPASGKLLPLFGRGGLFAAANCRGEPNGEDATMNALRAVWLLLQDAEQLREVKRRRREMRIEAKGRPEERAIKRLAANLADLYWQTWMEPPTVALNDDGEATSPFLRMFVQVQNSLRERGVDTHIRTAESLAKQWQRLDDWEACRFKSS